MRTGGSKPRYSTIPGYKVTALKQKQCSPILKLGDFVGNKAKGRISKRVFQENKARQISRKTNISYPLIRARKKCLFSGKFSVFFSWNTRFKIALLPYYRQLYTCLQGKRSRVNLPSISKIFERIYQKQILYNVNDFITLFVWIQKGFQFSV